MRTRWRSSRSWGCCWPLGLPSAGALSSAGLGRIRGKAVLGPSSRRAFALALALLLVVVAGVGLARVGGPQAAVRRAYDAFNAPAPLVKTNESQRLFSLPGSSRSEYWRVAWREYEDQPWLGDGAGSYQRFWLRDRREGLPVLDAHSLYLETLSELGPLGLVLLLGTLALLLGAARAARRHPLACAALGAYVAFLVHAGIDWDWEMPAVTTSALICGAALAVSARGEGGDISLPTRGALLLAVLALGATALVRLHSGRALPFGP